MNPYSSTLLNDLHHHFPELLYRQEQFQTVQDILHYITEVASVNHFQQERSRYISGLSVPSQELEEKEEKVYNFTASSSAYSTPVFAPAPASSSSASPASASPASASSDSLEAEALLQALFRRRSYAPVSQPSTSRFRMSVPFHLSSFLSSEYSASAPPAPPASSALHSLSQLNDLLRPVIIRPTDQHLSENTYVYRSEISLNDNCSICQDPMEAGQETRTILACSHCFHRECIDRWFQEHVQCPTCRHDVREST